MVLSSPSTLEVPPRDQATSGILGAVGEEKWLAAWGAAQERVAGSSGLSEAARAELLALVRCPKTGKAEAYEAMNRLLCDIPVGSHAERNAQSENRAV